MTTNFENPPRGGIFFIDFKLWCLAVKIYKFGYHLTDSGKSLSTSVVESTSEASGYTTNSNNNNIISQKNIDSVFNSPPIFPDELIPFSYYSLSIKSTKGKTLWVFDASKQIVVPYPFKSIAALSTPVHWTGAGISSAAFFYIDTGNSLPKEVSFTFILNHLNKFIFPFNFFYYIIYCIILLKIF